MAGISAPASWAPVGSEDPSGFESHGLGNLSISPRGMKYLIGISVGLALLAALGVLPGGFGAEAELSGTVVESDAHRIESVRQGDSLWAIATRALPDRDPVVAVHELRALNGPAAAKLRPGQVLLLP